MMWNAYQQDAMKTAIFPVDRSLDYTVLGLLSELGELVEARAANVPERIKGELGDNFWYVAAIADTLKTPLYSIYVWTTTKRPVSAYESMDALMVLGGLIAGHVKKSIRDENGYVSLERADNIRECLSKYMHHLEFITDDYGSLGGILNGNLDKLASRKKRDVLTGSGDNR